MLSPLIFGLVATAGAVLNVFAWMAIGTFVVRDRGGSEAFDAAVCLIIGASATSLGYTAFALIGAARAGALLVAAGAFLFAFVRRRRVLRLVQASASRLAATIADDGFNKLLVSLTLFTLLVYAFAPPRDGDVVRYHLAHIRQIATDGSWQWLPDINYALPFAWSLNYLPFEVAGLPQGAAILNVCLWVIVLTMLLEATDGRGSATVRLLVCLCFLAHPFIIKVFSAGFADAYAILVTTSIAVALMRLPELKGRDLALLGFICWIGMASRYQMVAISVAGSLLVLVHFAQERSWDKARLFLTGAAIAVIVSSPFYLMNWKNVGNPFWPLSTPFFATDQSFVQRVGHGFSAQYSWPASESLAASVKRLIAVPDLAPLPIVLIILSIATFFQRDGNARRARNLAFLFLGLWLAMSPRLYPTHILPIVALGPLMVLPLFQCPDSGTRSRKFLQPSLKLIVGAFVTMSLIFSLDYARYDFTGNSKEYHRFTWYYPVYDWANHNTRRESRFLVVVFSGLSYYLDRPYRRADPWLSAEIDWARVGSPATLDSIMKQRGFDYLIYDDRYWNQYAGGEMMSGVVHSAVSRKVLLPVFRSRERLYSGRVKREYTETDVYVYRRASAK